MNLFVFLLIGVVAGWLAGRIMKGRGFGLAGDLKKPYDKVRFRFE